MVLLAVLGGLLCPAAPAQTYQFTASEAAFDARYAATPIGLSGNVTRGGAPVAGATVRVIAWDSGTGNAGRVATTTAPAGTFRLTGLVRRNVLLEIRASGHYTEIVPVDLQRPVREAEAHIGIIALTPAVPGRVRLLFGGDTVFGRRFVDQDGDGAEGEPWDLIRPGSRATDAQALLAYVRDAMAGADYSVVNLDSPVTADPSTPHPFKSVTLFSYPETLSALRTAGVDAVSVANNHVFDYLARGVVDTLAHLAGGGLDWTGAEMNEPLARGTTISRAIRGTPLSIQGFRAIVADGSTEPAYLLVARDPDKPGALHASATNLSGFLAGGAASAGVAIPLLHAGREYSTSPSASARGAFVSLVQQGADLVVAHHPHTVQGVGLVDGGGLPRYVLMSLGNLLFDQEVFETFRSFLAVADVEALPGAGHEVARLRLIPYHIEDYVPRLLAAGELARAGRHLGHLSSTLPRIPSAGAPADGLRGAVVFPSAHRVVALRGTAQYTTASTGETVDLAVGNGLTSTLDFAPGGPADFLWHVRTGISATALFGRDILLGGGFEDGDVDGEFSEGSMWDQTAARYVQTSVVRSGHAALVLLRSSTNTTEVAALNRNRIAFPAGARLTFRGFVRGNNAGTVKVTTRFYDDAGAILSSVDRYTRAPGTCGWTRYHVNVTAPANATGLRIYSKQTPPASGEGQTFVDDAVVILWDRSQANAQDGLHLPTPNDWSHVRFTGVPGGVTHMQVTLGHRSFSEP
jgi:hypothetical protein